MPSSERRGSAALKRFLIGEDSLEDALSKLAFIAVETVPGVDLASITVLRNGKPQTPSFTEKDALNLDESQYKAGDGPCLAAIRHVGLETHATATETRWSEFDAAAAEAGILGTLSVALASRDDEAVGGLNLYSRSTFHFSDDACEAAVGLAGEIAVAVANVLTFEDVSTLAKQLEEAMASRAVIEQAKGILIAAQRCSPDEAFDILRRASQRDNRKLREMAAEIVERAQQVR